MGASLSSTAGHGSSSSSSPEEQQQESLAASTGFLPLLRASFSKLSQPRSTIPVASLQDALSLTVTNFASESLAVPPDFSHLLNRLGVAMSSFFAAADGCDEISWVDFLKGYNRYCARMPISQSINLLFRLYSAMCREVGISCGLEFYSGDSGDGDDGKVGGSLGSSELLIILWMSWVMMQGSRISKLDKGVKDGLLLPDLTDLTLSALVSCGVVADDENVWNSDVFGADKSFSAQKLQTWILTTASGLSNCLSKYVQERLQACAASEDGVSSSSSTLLADYNSTTDELNACLLTRGRAWAISITLRDGMSEELLLASFQGMSSDNLLYRSSVHGKGLSRFWVNVEGYNGPLMILISSRSANDSDDNKAGRWVIGVLTGQGLENRETFFGSSGYLYGISPIFHVLPSSGKERNFIYCHLHPAVRVYEPNPKPVGLGFGGAIGSERIFLDEDFSQITIRHHSVDKTYQRGALIPNQGFLPVQTSVMEVEVWGFGGKTAKEQQDAYKKREMLFSEQRRKVDLKTFASWEDSPEKMMMDMVSDPNRVQREER